MQNDFWRSLVGRIGSFILAQAMILSLFGVFNVQPARTLAAEGTDLSVCGLYVQGRAVRVSLYDVGGSGPNSALVALYKDGRRIYLGTENLGWDGNTALVEVALDQDCTNCDLAVTVYAQGDVDRRNDNLSVSIGASSTFPTEASEDTTSPTTPPTVPPTSPVTVKTVTAQATAGSDGVTLTWGFQGQGDEEPDRYEIRFNGQIISANAPGSRTFTGLGAGISYSYTVKAFYMNEEKSSVTGTVTTQTFIPTGNGWDLTVTSVTWEPKNPKAGEKVVFSATIRNVGGSATPSNTKHGLKFTIGEAYVWNDQFFGPLQPGESVTLTASGGSGGSNTWSGAAGSYSVTALVNDDGNTGSEDRDNNGLSVDFSVGDVTPVTPPTDGMGQGSDVNVAAAGCYGGRENKQVCVVVNGKKSPSINGNVNYSRVYDVADLETVPVNIFELKEGGTATVRIGLADSVDLGSAVVRPLSAGITPEIITMGNGQKYIQFTVARQGSYVVEYNGQSHGGIHLFVNPVYTRGQYEGDYLPLGSVRETGGNYGMGGTVYGSGVLVKTAGGGPRPAVKAYSGAKVYGITLLNENVDGFGGWGVWNVEINGASGLEFRYFHIVAAGANSDGISIQSSSNVRIYDSFVHTWDDSLVVKNYNDADSNDIHAENCVLWADLAQAMEIGAETNKKPKDNPQIYNVSFRNIDVIHACHKPAISIHNMDNAWVHGITWEDITIEDASMGLNAKNREDGWPILIDLTTVKGGEIAGTDRGWSQGAVRGQAGRISDVTLKNIQVLSWKNSAGVIPGIRLAKSGEVGGDISGVTVQGLYYRRKDGTVLQVNAANVNRLCGWNPADLTNSKCTAIRLDYSILNFEEAGDVVLPDPGLAQSQGAGVLMTRLTRAMDEIFSAVGAVGRGG